MKLLRGVNKTTVGGNLGSDPDVRYDANGNAYATLDIASNEPFPEKVDEKTGNVEKWGTRAEWHRVVCRGRDAETAGTYLKKGDPVMVWGRLRTRSWEDKNGITRYTTEIICKELLLLGGQDGTSSGSGKSSRAPHPADVAAPTSTGPTSSETPLGTDHIEEPPTF